MIDTRSVLAIGDVHGCLKTLLALIKAHGQDRRIILLGDLIDRGPNSRGVVEWAMKEGIETCYGNHEDLAIAYSLHERLGFKAKCPEHYDQDVWLYNGGLQALDNWGAFTEESRFPLKVLKWMSELPAYIRVPHPSGGADLLCSHTGYGLNGDTGHWISALWGRHPDGDGAFPDDGLFRVFGHCRKREPIIAKTHAMIDIGAAYKGYRVLTGLLWPEMTLVQQATID